MFFGRRKEKDLSELRNQQIQSFQAAVPIARKINPQDDSAFDVLIPSASTTALLRVIFPPKFPEAPPVLKLYGLQVRHPWLDVAGVVSNHPRLQPWDMNNNVGEIVQQVIAEITKAVGGSPGVGAFNGYPGTIPQGPFPPQPMTGYPGQAIPYQGPRPTTGRGVGMGQPPPYFGMPIQPPPPQYGATVFQQPPPTMEPARPPRPQIPSVTLPPIPVTFPDINDMPLENLERLLNDEVAFSIYLRNMSQVKDCNRILEEVRKQNVELAKANVSSMRDYESAKKEVESLQGIVGDMKKTYEQKLKAQGPSTVGISREELSIQLETLAHESEEKSEETARSFANGESKMADFAPEYLKHRKRYHELMAKLETLHRR